MLTTISTQNGTQIVYIPKELQFPQSEGNYEILRIGTSLLIRPVATQKLTHLMSCFATFTPDFMADGRCEQGEQQRDSL
jgi:antitoxin VapB